MVEGGASIGCQPLCNFLEGDLEGLATIYWEQSADQIAYRLTDLIIVYETFPLLGEAEQVDEPQLEW